MTRRAGFSLAELVVAMGILILMLSLAGQVFTLTMQSTGQATALTDLMQQLRAVEQTLREDLSGVQPGYSMILIQGNPVNAYWTQNGRDSDVDATASTGGPATGYPHSLDPEREYDEGNLKGNLLPPRADMLMIFTSHRGSSFAGSTRGLTTGLQQVVYGHAELGDYVASETAANGYEFHPLRGDFTTSGDLDSPIFPVDKVGGVNYPSTTGISHAPAEQWHLARRTVLMVPTDKPDGALVWDEIESKGGLAYNPAQGGLLDGASDVVRLTDPMPPGNSVAFEDLVLRPQPGPIAGDFLYRPWYLPRIFGDSSPAQLLKPFVRSRLDPVPPPLLADRLGHFFLPNCAYFKVEWSLNPRSEFVAGRLDGAEEVFWFDPGDPGEAGGKPDPLYSLASRVKALVDAGSCSNANDENYDRCLNLRSLLRNRTYHPDGEGYSLCDRFRGSDCGESDPEAWEGGKQLAPDGKRPNLVAFTAARPVQGTFELVPDDMFPGALRITIDVFDKDRRLERPIRHVMVIPVGG